MTIDRPLDARVIHCWISDRKLLITIPRLGSMAARFFVSARVESVNGNRGGQQRRCLRG